MATIMSEIDSSRRFEQAFIFVISIGYTFLALWRFFDVAWLKDKLGRRLSKDERQSVPLISSSP